MPIKLEALELYTIILTSEEGFNFDRHVDIAISNLVSSSTNIGFSVDTRKQFNSSVASSTSLSVSADFGGTFNSSVSSATHITEDLGYVFNSTVVSSSSFILDVEGDTPVISSTESTYTQASPIPITVTFPEEQIGFELSDIVVGNGTKGNFVDNNDGTYTFDLTPSTEDACTIDIPAGVCTDQNGNENEKADQFTIFYDVSAPTVSDSAFSSESNITNSGFTANWIKATDNVSDSTNLVYKLYSSLSNDIDTVSNIIANGTFEEQGTDVDNLDVTGYSDGDEVYYNVIAEDQAGNQLGYTMNSQVLEDDVAPTITSPGISTEEVGEHTFDMVFQEADDNITAHAQMKYHGYTSESDNLNSVADAEANGTFQETVTGELRITCDGLETDTLYYGQIVAEDEDGNKAIYDAVQQRTAKFGDAVLSQAQIFP